MLKTEESKQKGPKLKAVTITYHDAETIVLPSNEYANISTFQGYTEFVNREGLVDKKLNGNKVMLLLSGNNQAMVQDLVTMVGALVSQMVNE